MKYTCGGFLYANDSEIISSFLRILQGVIDVYLIAVGSSPEGIVPTFIDILSGSVTCILYCAPWKNIALERCN